MSKHIESINSSSDPSKSGSLAGVDPRQLVHGKYFPYIDGIRALAVLPVVFYHIFPWLCPGGFTGVDVFFVISGYLITGNILRSLDKGRFTIRDFYHHRIRRIFPANFALILGVFISGCIFYYSVPLKRLGDTMVASTLFSANLFFWNNVGDYFAPEVHQNPLLNLWSLSVEEQFYLFIPLLSAVVFKFRNKMVIPVLVGLGILSFSASIYSVSRNQQSSAFYLLQYRAWELLVGCILAAMVHFRQQTRDSKKNYCKISSFKWMNNNTLLGFIGLLMVIIPYLTLSSSTPFPGLSALPSVLGTAMLIQYGQSGLIGRVLAWRPMISIGLISYSLYLWHWPVIVFWKYAVYNQLYFFDYVGMFLLSFLLAYLSWRFIEVPIRISSKWTMRRSFSYAGIGLVFLLFIGATTAFSRGWPTILHSKANELTAQINIQTPSSIESGLNKVKRRTRLLLGKDSFEEEVINWRLLAGLPGEFVLGEGTQPEIALIGDSHAGVLGAGVDVWLRENKRSGLLFTQSATPMFDLSLAQSQNALLELDRHPTIKKVILAQGWYYILGGDGDSEYNLVKLEEFTREITDRGINLYICSDVPLFNGTDIAAKSFIIKPRKMKVGWDGTLTRQQHNEAQGQYNTMLIELCRKTNTNFVPLHLAFMQDDHYVEFEEQNGKKIALYRNFDHISVEGSVKAGRFLMPRVFKTSSSLISKPKL